MMPQGREWLAPYVSNEAHCNENQFCGGMFPSFTREWLIPPSFAQKIEGSLVQSLPEVREMCGWALFPEQASEKKGSRGF